MKCKRLTTSNQHADTMPLLQLITFSIVLDEMNLASLIRSLQLELLHKNFLHVGPSFIDDRPVPVQLRIWTELIPSVERIYQNRVGGSHRQIRSCTFNLTLKQVDNWYDCRFLSNDHHQFFNTTLQLIFLSLFQSVHKCTVSPKYGSPFRTTF